MMPANARVAHGYVREVHKHAICRIRLHACVAGTALSASCKQASAQGVHSSSFMWSSPVAGTDLVASERRR